jgi:hypothetical protein
MLIVAGPPTGAAELHEDVAHLHGFSSGDPPTYYQLRSASR